MTGINQIAKGLSDAQRVYLLTKRGLYYGPNNQGYTGLRERAGRYFQSDADGLSGVGAIHEDEAPEFAPACWQDVKVSYLQDIIVRQRAEIAALRTHLKGLPND
jgi:hypothetical protein